MSNPIHPTSQTPQQLTLSKLKQLMPEAFSEGQLDIHKLTALLSEQDIAPAQEAYGLSWAGKHQVYRELKTPTSQTLVPEPDESVNFDTSQNLFIEGDNLAVLKILQKSYHSRIKMIYIDPPYNTGNDRFVYADDFSESIADYKARAGQTDADGNLTHSDGMRGNRKENGQYHSNWLNMMYPRLALAKSLLREDGVIFVSIDDNEVANLRLLMDEIFGEENFATELIWKSRQNVDSRNKSNISNDHEYIIVYCKDVSKFKFTGKSIDLKKYSNPDNDPRGPWMSNNILGLANKDQRPNLHYTLIDPETNIAYECPAESGWRFSKETMAEKVAEKRIVFPKKKSGRPREKVFLNELSTRFTGFSSFLDTDNGFTLNGTREVRELFDSKYFDFPKPLALLKNLIKQGSNDNDIILDFFAGSATTAHAVMALNAEEAENNEAGKRKFIMVQIPEATEADSEAYKAGFTNIAEISKERIRRAAAHITSELPESVDSKALDFGFKAYTLADSNFIPWQQPASYDADSLMAQLEKHLDPISDNATTDGIITELMLKEGYTLTAIVSEGDGYYLVTQNDALIDNFDADSSDNAGTSIRLAIVLDDMTTDKATQIIARAPNKTLIMDRAFSDDANKANIVLQFEDAGLVVGCV
ncbi:site-specific DNA-methyltransferase [Psychrobacter coccoides]|nr:site-specific DNA-methyltransferase [Psychrobacter coccoides]